MKLQVIDKSGNKADDYSLDLSKDIREDIFKRAVLAEESWFRESSGAHPSAGKRQVINLSKRRRAYRGTYGRGMSRTPLKVLWRRGRQMRYVGAFAPNTVGGRKAHPPKAEKDVTKHINNKEWLKALRSGVAASLQQDVVSSNGPKVPEGYPFILDDSVEELAKTRDVEAFFKQIGFGEELERISERKVRAGKGTRRGRTYKEKRGPLVVVSSLQAPLVKGVRNVKGVDVVTPEFLLVSDFGMSQNPGRAVLFTKSAMEEFKEVLV